MKVEDQQSKESRPQVWEKEEGGLYQTMFREWESDDYGFRGEATLGHEVPMEQTLKLPRIVAGLEV